MYLGTVDHKPILESTIFIYKSFQPYLGLEVFFVFDGGASFVRMTNFGEMLERNVGSGLLVALVVCSRCGGPSFVRKTMLGGDVVQGGIK